MEWINNDKYDKLRIAESDVLLELKAHLQNKKCKVTLSECEWFWRLKPDSNGNVGCMGATGVVGACGSRSYEEAEKWNNRPAQDSKNVQVSITFPMSKANAVLVTNSKLSLTKNTYGNTLTTWRTDEKHEGVYYTCGVYKKDGFDEAFRSMQKLKPTLSEKDFAMQYDEWDEDLVDVRLYDTNDCIAIERKYDYISTGIMMVTLTLLEIDIMNNLHFIKNIVN